MSDIIANFFTLFGGVLGAVIGFLVIVGVLGFLTLPYWMMTNEATRERGLKTPLDQKRDRAEDLEKTSSLI